MQITTSRLPISKTGTIFVSEEAIAVLLDLKAAFASPPTFLRRSLRRSEDFWHRRAVMTMPAPGLPHLLRTVSLSLKGQDVSLQHHVVSTGDPGTLYFRPENVECAPRILPFLILHAQECTAPHGGIWCLKNEVVEPQKYGARTPKARRSSPLLGSAWHASPDTNKNRPHKLPKIDF
jgi:hypothetical protein